MPQQVRRKYDTARQLEEILNQVEIGTWEWDFRTNDVTWSENMSQFLGLSSASGKLKITRNQCTAPIHKDDLDFVEKEINDCIQENRRLKLEYRVVWPDNTIHWVQARGSLVYLDDNVPSHMLGVMFDITKRKDIEQALHEAQKLASLQNKAKSDFLSSMSHELRNPLNAIIGFSQLISDDSNLTDEQKEFIGLIKSSGEHLTSLIDEILDLSKIEAGKIDIIMEDLSLKDLLSKCMEIIDVKENGKEKNLSMDLGECDNEYIKVDKKRFTQVMINLLSNAVKYNRRQGSVHVSCGKSEGKIRIFVKDNGFGLNEEQKNKLFEPFERLGAEKTNIEGTGIGLVITKQLIELMNGQIGVESEPGLGTVFWIECVCA